MSGHPDLGPRALERLRAEAGTPQVPRPAPAPVEGKPRSHRVRAKVRRLVRHGWTGRLFDRLLDPFAARVGRTVEGRALGQVFDLAVDVKILRSQLDALWPAVAAVEGLGMSANVIAVRGADMLRDLEALQVNQELLKAELMAFHATLEEFGRAISPGEGLGGAPRQLAELRQQLNALDRRVRLAPTAGATGTVPTSSGQPSAARPAEAPAPSGSFDYVGFEHRFRGDTDEILRRTFERYLDALRGRGPVLDVGCGRGELLAGLAEHGIEGVGVDLDPEMVAEARERGVEAHVGDAIEFLASVPEASYGAITAIQVAEHLELDHLIAFLDLAATRLAPGGVLIAETPNPASLIVLSRSYILDPTHVWPLHPSLLTFLCERAGFLTVEERFFSPAEDLQLPLLDQPPDAPEIVVSLNQSLNRLNQVLFGPQDYAVVATTG
ncbi:MAG: class I SAM-dependent methyltransferase [Actinobacteria bacterium]|nr:class I SAM-dependent methyltransferase [Actinomycetota bacterium]